VQLARFEELCAAGFDGLVDVDTVALVGHSQGLLGALGAAQLRRVREPADRTAIVTTLVRAALHLGAAMEEPVVPAASPLFNKRSLEATGQAPTPMAALSGPSRHELRELIVDAGVDVVVAIENAPFHHTVAGAPGELEALRAFAVARHQEQLAQKKRASGQAASSSRASRGCL
jgi:malonyl CoA-acyl carrier protein transacylase